MAETRTKTGQFVKGVSGNPTGKPALLKDVQELARTYTEDAIKGLHSIATNAKSPAQAKVAAWNSILDRAWGKAGQSIDLNAGVSTDLASLLEQIGEQPKNVLPNGTAAH